MIKGTIHYKDKIILNLHSTSIAINTQSKLTELEKRLKISTIIVLSVMNRSTRQKSSKDIEDVITQVNAWFNWYIELYIQQLENNLHACMEYL